MKKNDFNKQINIDCRYGRIKLLHHWEQYKTMIWYKGNIDIQKLEFEIFCIKETYNV